MKQPIEPCSGRALYEVDVLGAENLISYHGGRFMHSRGGARTYPRVEVSTEGVRVGCSFVTERALLALLDAFHRYGRRRIDVVQP